MITFTDDTRRLFNDVQQDITDNVRRLMEELWLNWTHLGVDEPTKSVNITKLVQIEKELHRDVIFETRQKLKNMQAQVDKLKEETEELSSCLSVDITILDFKEDMTLIEYKRELENQITGYRQQMEQRRMKIDRLLEWQKDLMDKLGVTLGEIQQKPLPSEQELDDLKEQLEILQVERDKRVETFLNVQMEIKDIMEKLNIQPSNKFEQTVVTSLSVDFKVTDFNMDRLSKLRQDLHEKFEHTNNRVLELRERLTKLWDCLDEDQIYRENFLHAHPGCHPYTENAIREEIKRCDQIKRQKIQVFVANMRTKIKLMWDNCMYSQEERENFVHYYQDIFSEDTLTLHELYLEQLHKHYNENKHILDLVATRKSLWVKMSELESRATEPGRYHNRGGQLLKEEKERKAIANNLPKIEAELSGLVNEYENKTGKTFTVDGKPILQLIAEEWESRKAERQNKVSARKQALTPNAHAALFRSLATSPLGKRNRTAAGLPATNEKTRLVKRQLITASANKAVSSVTNNLSAFKRSAMSTVKRRLSGRIAARALADGNVFSKRKLNYEDVKLTPKVNGSILKHKRGSLGKRRSSGRRRSNTTQSTVSSNEEQRVKDPLLETTQITTYTDFKDAVNDKASRSSLAHNKAADLQMINNNNYKKTTPRKAPRILLTSDTPKIGKENINGMTPKSNLLHTPTRLTRSAIKLNNEGFATPRMPFCQNKMNVQRQNTVTNVALKITPSPIRRSKTHTNLVRAKNLPPLI